MKSGPINKWKQPRFSHIMIRLFDLQTKETLSTFKCFVVVFCSEFRSHFHVIFIYVYMYTSVRLFSGVWQGWYVQVQTEYLSCPQVIQPQLQVQLPRMKSQSSTEQQHSQNRVVTPHVQEASTRKTTHKHKTAEVDLNWSVTFSLTINKLSIEQMFYW